MNIEEILGTIEEVSVSDRVKFFRKIRDLNLNPDKPGKVLEEMMQEIPDKITELIRKTSFAPIALIGRGRAFDHELENFLFCFEEANVYLYPTVTKALWDKLLNETPERNLYGLKFIARYIETHPDWEKFARFIFNDLFDGPRRNWESQDAVLKGLVSVNGLWPRAIIQAIEELPNTSKLRCLTRTISEEEKARRIVDLQGECEEIERHGLDSGKELSVEQSHMVINEINKLFFG
ncbi:MAG: hypothetical protein Q8L09_04585 [Candidatus Moranbacteria bacterium]|nr:hypothetical protein [Candidatus Moranbacteria bacterium]